MIGSIRGKVVHLNLSRAVIDVGGVGYIVHSSPACLGNMHLGKEVSFWTYTAVRETDISLYGFETEEELIMFEKLLSVSGIGPKSALTILSVAGLKTLEDAVISGNTAILHKIAGVGKKTADKIVLELTGKISTSNVSEEMQEDMDVIEALKTLGYKDHTIKDIMKEIPQNISGANDKIKQALKLLSNK